MLYFQRLCTRTFRVTEYMKLCHIQPGNKFIGIFKELSGFTACTHNHIHTDKGIWHYLFYFFYFRSKMRHKTTGTGYKFYNLICQQVRFDGRNTIALNAFHFIKGFHQIKKSFSGRLTEITDIHTGKHNLLTAFGSSLTSLLLHRSNRSVSATPTSKRNGTIRTKIIAAILYLQKKAGTISPRTRRCKRTDIFGCRSISFSFSMLLQIT